MKKIISCLLIVVLLLSSFVFADGENTSSFDLKGFKKAYSSDTLFYIDSDAYSDGILTDSKTIDVKGEYYTKVVDSGKKVKQQKIGDVIAYGAVDYVTYQMRNIIHDTIPLYFLNNPIAVGSHTIWIEVTWQETWLVDQFGNNISLESKTSPAITNGWTEYDVLTGFYIWESFAFSSSIAASNGKVDSWIGGSTSFYHSVNARYN